MAQFLDFDMLLYLTWVVSVWKIIDVQQGSNLGPLFFILLMTLQLWLLVPNISCILYDLKMYKFIRIKRGRNAGSRDGKISALKEISEIKIGFLLASKEFSVLRTTLQTFVHIGVPPEEAVSRKPRRKPIVV